MSFIEAYLKAEYHVDGFAEPILIGRENAELGTLLKANKASEWCFITAWNPMSQELSRSENEARNEELGNALSEYAVFGGEGRDPEGIWEAERSFLVIGISRANAVALARKYNQRAILYGTEAVAELLET